MATRGGSPIGGVPVVLHLAVRRFRCRNRRCPRQTFAEQVPTLTPPYGRRTAALRGALEPVGLLVGARPGQRLGRRRGWLGSRDGWLRLVRALPVPAPPPARVPACTVAGRLLRQPEHLNAAEVALLDRLCARCAELVTTRRLVRAFAELVCQRQGEPVLRRALWLAALSASRSNPDLAAYLQRRLDQGTPWGTAVGAVARKLLSRVYVILKHNRPYEVH